MKRTVALAAFVGALAAVVALVAVQVAGATGHRAAAPKDESCKLANGVKHVIYLQFDNTHFNRDDANSSVASDLEQMPHLLKFLKKNGTLFTNDHTILISHTAGGILSSLTGLYPDRQGQTVSNSYDYFDSGKTPHNTSSFKYWTSPVDPVNDTLPNMITDTGKTTPAPWVPFTRAGCDVGGVGTANIELENNRTDSTGDITQVFGQGSPEWNETVANPQQGQTDFVGIAIHCSKAPSSACADNSNAKPDLLPDEPLPDASPGGGYLGYQALYGAKYVDPAIANGSACVDDTNGNAVTDPDGYCGFPGFDGMFAQNTLGYVEAMQEHGVPVTYGYISDAHDLHAPIASSDSYSSAATGPGELGHLQQLKAYDTAFENFFHNLKQHGIDRHNTLFVVTVDEGDHFAGGVGTPQSGQDWLLYNHTTCTNLSQCPTNQIGEVDANIKGLLAPDYSTSNPMPAFDIHFDDAPAFYLNGQPGPTDPKVRALERNVGNLTSVDPYIRDSGGTPQTVPLAVAMADPVEEQALHMVNADPNRTPTFTMFGNADFFFQTSNPCSGVSECVLSGFAWNHGDIQPEIGNTWVGMVGPGVEKGGIDPDTWTDHTNVRPTILSLVGLKDDYVDDGHVLVQALSHKVLPSGLSGSKIADLEAAYEQLNASFGEYSADTLRASTFALKGTDADYSNFASQMAPLETDRESLAKTIKDALFDAAFNGGTISDAQATNWINQANADISAAAALPH
jgi:hypothetical protein